MAHVARCINQVHAINENEGKLNHLCVNSKGKDIERILFIDFKMEFEAKSTMESTVQYFGKKGVAFCALIYYLYEVKKDNNEKYIVDINRNYLYYPKKYLA